MILGAVLAGGRSRRFGSDKAVAVLDGAALIDRVIAALRPQVDALVVCGRMIPAQACLSDRPAPDLGPLGGLNAALHHARDTGFARVLSVPCDAPFLPGDLVDRLAGPPCHAAAMPVIGLWPATLADALDRHLATQQDRSMRRWARVAGSSPVDLGGVENVNTPVDLDRLRAAVPTSPSP